MLVYSLIVITIIIWSLIYFCYFREQIVFWFQNHFGKEARKRKTQAPSGPVVPFSYDPPPEEKEE